MDIDLLAASSAALISQSYFTEVGKSAWEGTVRLLTSVRTKLQGNHAAESALETVCQDPNNQAAGDALRFWLAASMRHDSEFLNVMTTLIDEARNTTAGSQIIAQTHNDYKNAKIGKVVNIDTVNGDLNF